VTDYLDIRTEKMRASSYLVLGAVVLALAVTTLAVEVEELEGEWPRASKRRRPRTAPHAAE